MSCQHYLGLSGQELAAILLVAQSNAQPLAEVMVTTDHIMVCGCL